MTMTIPTTVVPRTIEDKVQLQEKKTSVLSYNPTPDELPLFESIFRAADVSKNGNIIKCNEALEVLSLSGISKKKLVMILNMVRNKDDKACSLHREQFYVAVRLVQFRQNRESVRDLNLTVPDNVYLKAPYFRGISEAESEKTTLVQISKHRDIEQSSTESSTNLSLRCVEMEREINKLKKELQTTVKQLNAVTKNNFVLKNGQLSSADIAIVQPPSSKLVERVGTNTNNDKMNAGKKTGVVSFEMNTSYTTNNGQGEKNPKEIILDIEDDNKTTVSALTEFTRDVHNELPTHFNRYRQNDIAMDNYRLDLGRSSHSDTRDIFQNNYSVIRIPRRNSEISDITELTFERKKLFSPRSKSTRNFSFAGEKTKHLTNGENLDASRRSSMSRIRRSHSLHSLWTPDAFQKGKPSLLRSVFKGTKNKKHSSTNSR